MVIRSNHSAHFVCKARPLKHDLGGGASMYVTFMRSTDKLIGHTSHT